MDVRTVQRKRGNKMNSLGCYSGKNNILLICPPNHLMIDIKFSNEQKGENKNKHTMPKAKAYYREEISK